MTTPNVTPLLWVGSLENTRAAVRQHIIDVVSACKGCATCYFCCSLRDSLLSRECIYGVPPFVIWLVPKDHGYVREQIEDALIALTVVLDVHESSVIVIESADQLNNVTANRLLKIIEEPPPGWHIILTTERPIDVLQTLRSRCIEKNIGNSIIQKMASTGLSNEQLSSAPLLWLENPQRSTWLTICSKIDELPRTVPAALSALDRLIKIWHDRWIELQDPQAEIMLTILTNMVDTPPSNGGTTAFWRVLLVRVHSTLKS
jgi:hypothetical protein